MAMNHRGAVGQVYVARARGAIKVGFTTAPLERRMRQIQGVLIASAPGSFIQEQYLIRTLAPYRSPKPLPMGREWFTDDALEPLWQAWERMFGERAA